jgi:hypothetical protein
MRSEAKEFGRFCERDQRGVLARASLLPATGASGRRLSTDLLARSSLPAGNCVGTEREERDNSLSTDGVGFEPTVRY